MMLSIAYMNFGFICWVTHAPLCGLENRQNAFALGGRTKQIQRIRKKGQRALMTSLLPIPGHFFFFLIEEQLLYNILLLQVCNTVTCNFESYTLFIVIIKIFAVFPHVVQYLYPYSLFYGEGNGTPLQYSCLENPMDGGAWQAAVPGVAKSRTPLNRLSSSCSSLFYT